MGIFDAAGTKSQDSSKDLGWHWCQRAQNVGDCRMGVMRVGTRLRQGCSDVFRRDTCVSLLKAAISLQECVASEHGWKTCGYCRKPYDELSADTGVSGLAHASDGSISNVSLGRSFARSTNPISSVRAIASYNISNVRCFSTGLGRGFIDDDRDIDDTGDNDFESAQALDNSNSIEDVQIALEHAMVEAYRLLQEDKVELAELLVTEGKILNCNQPLFPLTVLAIQYIVYCRQSSWL